MKNLFLNPFERFAGLPALLIGLAIIILTAGVASFGSIHLDGVLDFHVKGPTPELSGPPVSLALCLAEGVINWLVISVLLYLCGLIFSKSRIRMVDVFGTQALARFPFLIACVFTFFLFSDKIMEYMNYKMTHKGEPVEIGALDILSFLIMALVSIATIIWLIFWMYRAYSVSCNIKGTKSIVTFTVTLLLAEVISKLVINYLLL
jgi:hypothetical protein